MPQKEDAGIAPIEAMAAGLPAFAGRNSSVPELMGSLVSKSGGWMLEDRNLDAWVYKIKEVLSEFDKNRDFKYLSQDYCVNNARQFSWDKTAELTVSAYNYFLSRKA